MSEANYDALEVEPVGGRTIRSVIEKSAMTSINAVNDQEDNKKKPNKMAAMIGHD
ncbi:hypothetical protein JCM19231_2049 [Vibrio ishigakensis]|uniref:Uncharacterized protein n=1 Tax=Vibrio ishigakensis TaxID=1481914 RepID=A0A0B8NST0_9VIBR|nr:hypothetical protein [Vibrio ishigakensis]GAM56901.1 hypothetical protein JCM19231_2049 [Vibrio ishigakensis]